MGLLQNIFANVIVTGDEGKPWLIAICLIASIAMMITLLILGKGKKDDKDRK